MDSSELIEVFSNDLSHSSFKNETLYHVEDSGYTSPGPVEWSYDNVDSMSSVSFRSEKNNLLHSSSYITGSPIPRRGVKRTFHETSFPTPTSEIAGKIKILKVNDNCHLNESFLSSIHFGFIDKENHAYPTTPVKTCKKNYKISPGKKTGKRLDFSCQSLSDEGLQNFKQPVKEKLYYQKVRTSLFRINEKLDIIKHLLKRGVTPPVIKIFSYLSNEDIYHYSLANPKTWFNVTEVVYNVEEKKRSHMKYIRSRKENVLNGLYDAKIYNGDNHTRCLREINNIINLNNKQPHEKPQDITSKDSSTPNAVTTAVDIHIQFLSCVLCSVPAQVREDMSGEIWVECTKAACSYQFCKICKCERHPGQKCKQYDLEGPSPSKRKKVGANERKHAVGTSKSKKILRRL